MKKGLLFIGTLGLVNFIWAEQKVSKAELQETASNIATELQIPTSQRTSFETEYVDKSIALQEIMSRNISPQEKVALAKLTLNQSSANLKKVTPTVQSARYNNYFNKPAQLTASVKTVKTPSSNNNTSNSNTIVPNSYTKNVDYKKLPTEHQAVMDKIGIQLQLNNDQFGKMSTDYLYFVNTTESIAKNHANNKVAALIEANKMTQTIEKSTKSYLNNEQYTAFQTLLKQGKLGQDETPRVSTNTVNNNTPNTNNNASITNNSRNLSEIKSAQTLTDLKTALNLSTMQYNNALKVAQNYDAEIVKISKQFPNDINRQKTELDKKTPIYVAQFKAALQTQANAFFGVLIAQVNILTGQNLTAEQQNLINVMKNNYNMNDVQVIQSMFVIGEAKFRFDANKNINKNNTQAFNQENQKILGDANDKLKSILSTDQYNKVIADLQKMAK